MATKFKNGPAQGVALYLKAAPAFLRVVREGTGDWDALDLPDDKPEPGETVCAYRKVSDDGGSYLDGRDSRTGKRWGFYCPSATYVVCDPQPPEAVMRDGAAWRAWVGIQSRTVTGS